MDLDFSLLSASKTKNDTSPANYALANAETLITEAYSKLQSVPSSSVSKITQSAPTFSSLAASTGAVKLDYSLVAGAEKAKLEAIGTSTASASDIKSSTGTNTQENDDSHKVSLTSRIDPSEQVIFEIMPEVTEQRNIEYESLSPPQMPGEFQKYRGTKSTSWTISGTLTASTKAECAINYYYIRLLRSWGMPYFGSAQDDNLRGAPPPVLDFRGWRGLVGTVPVVITSMNWNWPKDVDWLPVGDAENTPFPAVVTVQINLVESYSASEFNSFDLTAFKTGNMVNAFSGTLIQTGTVDEPVSNSNEQELPPK